MRNAILLMTALLLASPTFAEDSSEGVDRRGKELYDAFCYICHGTYGRGNGPAAEYLALKPPDFTDWATFDGKTDEQIRMHLLPGTDPSVKRHTPMLMGEILNDEIMRATIAYIRTMSVPGRHVSIMAGRDLYNGICWVCHGVKGDGQGPAATKLGEAKPRDFTAPDYRIEGREEEVYQIISAGAEQTIHGSSYMIEWGTKLSPQQIRDIIEYLKTF